MNIGEQITTNRKALNMTQKELADLLLVTDKTISRWERGVSIPDVEMLKKLSLTINFDLNSVFSNIEIDNKEKIDIDAIRKYRIGYIASSALFIFSMILFLLCRIDLQDNVMYTIFFVLSIILIIASTIIFLISVIKFQVVFNLKHFKNIYKREIIVSITVILITLVGVILSLINY